MTRGRSRSGLLLVGALCAIGSTASCSRQPQSPADARPVVAVSVAPLGWVIQELAGDRVRIEVMVPPGASPATHEPSLAQMQALSRAALYLEVGHPAFAFERSWLGHLLERNESMRILSAAGRSPTGPDDPHLWTSPRVMRGLAQDAAPALAQLLPDAAEELQANLHRLEARIDSLDATIRTMLQPAAGCTFYVFHPAWGWFAADYGLHQVAIQEKEDHGTEPSPDHLARLIQQARRDGVQVVFVQPQYSERSAALVAHEIGARVGELDPLAPDWFDNLLRVAAALQKACVR